MPLCQDHLSERTSLSGVRNVDLLVIPYCFVDVTRGDPYKLIDLLLKLLHFLGNNKMSSLCTVGTCLSAAWRCGDGALKIV